MKNIIIGVSSLLMTLAGAEALAQSNGRGRAAQAAGQTVRGGEAAASATTGTINSTARGTQISGNGVAQGAGAVANGTSGSTTGEAQGSNLTGAAARAGNTASESASTGSNLLDVAGRATRTAVAADQTSGAPAGQMCAAGGGWKLSCDKVNDPAQQALVSQFLSEIPASEKGNVEALGRSISNVMGVEDGLRRAEGLIEGGCLSRI